MKAKNIILFLVAAMLAGCGEADSTITFEESVISVEFKSEADTAADETTAIETEKLIIMTGENTTRFVETDADSMSVIQYEMDQLDRISPFVDNVYYQLSIPTDQIKGVSTAYTDAFGETLPIKYIETED